LNPNHPARGPILIMRATKFVEKAFNGQYRKGAERKPKLDHLLEVAELVKLSGGDDQAQVAALLYDVVRDTPWKESDIERIFGVHICELVQEVTDPSGIEDLSTHEKKARQAKSISQSSTDAKRIKLAVQISNLRELAANPPEAWTDEKAMDYILGALRIAAACRGVSEVLDSAFMKAYQEVYRKYRPLSAQ
jgi:(p)ppGpp synthase/HD superfamily hydrolase